MPPPPTKKKKTFWSGRLCSPHCHVLKSIFIQLLNFKTSGNKTSQRCRSLSTVLATTGIDGAWFQLFRNNKRIKWHKLIISVIKSLTFSPINSSCFVSAQARLPCPLCVDAQWFHQILLSLLVPSDSLQLLYSNAHLCPYPGS